MDSGTHRVRCPTRSAARSACGGSISSHRAFHFDWTRSPRHVGRHSGGCGSIPKATRQANHSTYSWSDSDKSAGYSLAPSADRPVEAAQITTDMPEESSARWRRPTRQSRRGGRARSAEDDDRHGDHGGARPDPVAPRCRGGRHEAHCGADGRWDGLEHHPNAGRNPGRLLTVEGARSPAVWRAGPGAAARGLPHAPRLVSAVAHSRS